MSINKPWQIARLKVLLVFMPLVVLLLQMQIYGLWKIPEMLLSVFIALFFTLISGLLFMKLHDRMSIITALSLSYLLVILFVAGYIQFTSRRIFSLAPIIVISTITVTILAALSYYFKRRKFLSLTFALLVILQIFTVYSFLKPLNANELMRNMDIKKASSQPDKSQKQRIQLICQPETCQILKRDIPVLIDKKQIGSLKSFSNSLNGSDDICVATLEISESHPIFKGSKLDFFDAGMFGPLVVKVTSDRQSDELLSMYNMRESQQKNREQFLKDLHESQQDSPASN